MKLALHEATRSNDEGSGTWMEIVNDVTLRALQDPSRRPPVWRDPIPDDILNVVPTRLFAVDSEEFARNVRSAKRGAAGERGHQA